ncbi:MAG: hypothetical protein ACRDGG_02675 [Anaerolineae bacterium]
MTFSRWVRLIVAACAALWIAVPSLFAQDVPGISERGQRMQLDSPIPTPPVSPIASPADSPIPTPQPDPASGFDAFLPGLSQQPSSADNRPPGPPPDLGSVLNYVALAVIVIGVTLKIYWFISDRRKGAAK